MSRFQILNANLRSIYSKRFNFMVYTFICVFREIKFFWLLNLLGLLKKTQHLDSWPLSMPWKTRPWGDLLKNIVLYLMTVSFIRMWESFKRVFFFWESTVIVLAPNLKCLHLQLEQKDENWDRVDSLLCFLLRGFLQHLCFSSIE